jgi:hypothetical protein
MSASQPKYVSATTAWIASDDAERSASAARALSMADSSAKRFFHHQSKS